MTDRELKPCPFCGGEPDIYEYGDKHDIFDPDTLGYVDTVYYTKYGHGCPNCGCIVAEKMSKEEAIIAWNTRTNSAPQQRINLYDRLALVNEARKQAVMEFTKRLKEYKCSYDLDNCHSFEAVDVDDIDEVAKEMLGEDYDR